MNGMIEKAVDFFKPHLVTTTIQPKIKVEFHTYDSSLGDEYRKKWEGLLASLDPSTIKGREWRNYRSGYKYEEIIVDLDGVKIELGGAYYPDPSYKERAEPVLSAQEQADRQLDAIFGQYNFAWAITTASKAKVRNLLAYVQTIAGEKGVDQEVVEKAAERVITLLRLAKDVKL